MNEWEEPWRLEIVDLDRESAMYWADKIRQESNSLVVEWDPKHFLTRSNDRATVEILVRALRASLTPEVLEGEYDRRGVQYLLEDCEEWLRHAAPQQD